MTNFVDKDSINTSNGTNTEPDKKLELSSDGSEPSVGNNEEDNPASSPQDIDNDNVTENGEII